MALNQPASAADKPEEFGPDEPMNQGWIKLHRRLLDNPRFKDSKWVHVFITLLLKATHKPIRMIFDGAEIELQPGQLITSRITLSRETRISPTSIERLLETLETGHQIGQQTSNRSRLISILNWCEYQGDGQQDGLPADNKRTTNGQQTDTNKNDKKDKNEEKGEGPRAENGCALSAAISHFAGMRRLDPQCDYTDQEVRQAWLDLQATIDEHGYWAFGKKRIGDYRAGLESRILDNRTRKENQKTNGKHRITDNPRNAGIAGDPEESSRRIAAKVAAMQNRK